MRLITWNVAKRVQLLPEQAAALAGREPDVVALQEVTARSGALWEEALAAIGLPHVRRTAVLLATRRAHEPVEALPVPRPESAIAGRAGGVTVHNVHVPNAANGWVKIETLEAIRAGLASGTGARVLCGDLNTPRRELPDGSVMSFARDSRGRLRPERGERWDAGELGVVPGLRDLGFADAFRTLHGYASREPSWTWRRISGHGGGWRLDHVFASAQLRATDARYHHEWRDAGLSDHAALEVTLGDASSRETPRLPQRADSA